MSLNAILGTALSGLTASQAGLRNASDNVANVNTPGYARAVTMLTAQSVGGIGAGVTVAGVRRIADAFLAAASWGAAAASGSAKAQAGMLDRMQSQFGRFDDAGSLFSRLNNAFSSIAAASAEPAMSAANLSTAQDLQAFFDESARLSGEVRKLRAEADSRIDTTVRRINELLAEIATLNTGISNAVGQNNNAAENRRSQLLDELSALADIRVEKTSDGRAVVRTGDGVTLADRAAAELRFTPAGTGDYAVNYSRVSAVLPGGVATDLQAHIRSGELRGLLDLRDKELPDIALGLAELTAGTADALNAAHNNSTAWPAPQSLTGRNTGLMAADALNFTGRTSIAITAPDGTLVRRLDVDFDAGTISVNGGAPAAFGGTSIDDFATALDTALGADGSASFANGVLSISASGGNGVATLQDPDVPADRGGRGFAHFFGLNDLVRSPVPAFYETGLGAADAHGFTPGQQLAFRIETPDGRVVQDVSITVAGGSFADLLTQLNDPVSGLGKYASFSLDANGALVQSPAAGYEAYSARLTGDSTSRAGTGVSFSQLFGVGLAARSVRAEALSVDSGFLNGSKRLALAKLDFNGGAGVGDLVIASGDGRGGQALQAALIEPRHFAASGAMTAGPATIQDFAARLAGDVGARAARAITQRDSAAALSGAAAEKRSEVEGVSLDEELAAMTLYQQSYNASARLLQAAKEMSDVLLSMVSR